MPPLADYSVGTTRCTPPEAEPGVDICLPDSGVMAIGRFILQPIVNPLVHLSCELVLSPNLSHSRLTLSLRKYAEFLVVLPKPLCFEHHNRPEARRPLSFLG